MEITKRIEDYPKQNIEDEKYQNKDYGILSGIMRDAIMNWKYVDIDDYYYANNKYESFLSFDNFLGEPWPAELKERVSKALMYTYAGANKLTFLATMFSNMDKDDVQNIFPKFTKQQQNFILRWNEENHDSGGFWNEELISIAKGIYEITEIVRKPISREEYYQKLAEEKKKTTKELLGKVSTKMGAKRTSVDATKELHNLIDSLDIKTQKQLLPMVIRDIKQLTKIK